MAGFGGGKRDGGDFWGREAAPAVAGFIWGGVLEARRVLDCFYP